MTIYSKRSSISTGGGSGTIYPSSRQLATTRGGDAAILENEGAVSFADGVTAEEIRNLLNISERGSDNRLQISDTEPTARPDTTALLKGDIWVDTSESTPIINVYTGSAFSPVDDQTGTEIITAINASGTTGRIAEDHLDSSLPRTADLPDGTLTFTGDVTGSITPSASGSSAALTVANVPDSAIPSSIARDSELPDGQLTFTGDVTGNITPSASGSSAALTVASVPDSAIPSSIARDSEVAISTVTGTNSAWNATTKTLDVTNIGTGSGGGSSVDTYTTNTAYSVGDNFTSGNKLYLVETAIADTNTMTVAQLLAESPAAIREVLDGTVGTGSATLPTNNVTNVTVSSDGEPTFTRQGAASVTLTGENIVDAINASDTTNRTIGAEHLASDVLTDDDVPLLWNGTSISTPSGVTATTVNDFLSSPNDLNLSGTTLQLRHDTTNIDTVDLASINTDTNTTYTFADGTGGQFTVTPSGGTAQTVSVGDTGTAISVWASGDYDIGDVVVFKDVLYRLRNKTNFVEGNDPEVAFSNWSKLSRGTAWVQERQYVAGDIVTRNVAVSGGSINNEEPDIRTYECLHDHTADTTAPDEATTEVEINGTMTTVLAWRETSVYGWRGGSRYEQNAVVWFHDHANNSSGTGHTNSYRMYVRNESNPRISAVVSGTPTRAQTPAGSSEWVPLDANAANIAAYFSSATAAGNITFTESSGEIDVNLHIPDSTPNHSVQQLSGTGAWELALLQQDNLDGAGSATTGQAVTWGGTGTAFGSTAIPSSPFDGYTISGTAGSSTPIPKWTADNTLTWSSDETSSGGTTTDVVQDTTNIDLRVGGSSATAGEIVQITAGSGITLTQNNSQEFTIASTGGSTPHPHPGNLSMQLWDAANTSQVHNIPAESISRNYTVRIVDSDTAAMVATINTFTITGGGSSAAITQTVPFNNPADPDDNSINLNLNNVFFSAAGNLELSATVTGESAGVSFSNERVTLTIPVNAIWYTEVADAAPTDRTSATSQGALAVGDTATVSVSGTSMSLYLWVPTADHDSVVFRADNAQGYVFSLSDNNVTSGSFTRLDFGTVADGDSYTFYVSEV